VRTARGANQRHDGENKSAETGSRQVPRFGFCPENANLPIDETKYAIQENGVPGKEMWVMQAFDYACRDDPSESFSLCSCAWFSFWT
jgi:hypothetical protein